MKAQLLLCTALSTLSVLSATAQNPRPQRPDPSIAVKEVVDRIYNYLSECTPAVIVDGSEKPISASKIDAASHFQKGDFGINSYEWGVTYSGMLLASEVTADPKYAAYAYERMKVIGSAYAPTTRLKLKEGERARFTPLHTPKWLDDCGSMTAAMIKATLAQPAKGKDFRPLLDNWFDFVMNKEYRLSDSILARHRPAENSVWLDDMYMGITPIAYMGKLCESEGKPELAQTYYDEAVRQVLLFKKYLWVAEKGIYRHGWIEGMATHPDYHWARANGWAMLTISDVLDVIPEGTKGRAELIRLLGTLIENISKYQSPSGLWHQLIDQSETYLETSASAMYTYCIAHAVNQGWIDATAYRDVARTGWNGVATQVNAKGQVENTCVGTGLGWTNVFYANRPVSVFAAHGYGPVLLAGAEMLKLLKR